MTAKSASWIFVVLAEDHRDAVPVLVLQARVEESSVVSNVMLGYHGRIDSVAKRTGAKLYVKI